MQQLTPLSGRSEVTVTLAPDDLVPHGVDSPVPLVGYLVLAPAGTPLDDIIPALPRERRPEPEAGQRGASGTSDAPSPAPPAFPAPAAPGAPAPPARPAAAAGASAVGDGAGGIAIDQERRVVTVDGELLDLTYLEFELLSYLVGNPHRVYTREQLVSTIWGYGPVGDQRTVDVHVARLRRKLGAAYRGRIVTVRRVGYKYIPRG